MVTKTEIRRKNNLQMPIDTIYQNSVYGINTAVQNRRSRRIRDHTTPGFELTLRLFVRRMWLPSGWWRCAPLARAWSTW